MSSRDMRKRMPVLLGIAVALVLLAVSGTQAASLKTQNLTQLIAESVSIIEGTVLDATDGIGENGFPYTEVTIFVRSSAKGSIECNFTIVGGGVRILRAEVS